MCEITIKPRVYRGLIDLSYTILDPNGAKESLAILKN